MIDLGFEFLTRRTRTLGRGWTGSIVMAISSSAAGSAAVTACALTARRSRNELRASLLRGHRHESRSFRFFKDCSLSCQGKQRSRGRISGTRLRALSAASGKMRVAVDVDEVLARFLCSLNDFIEETHDEKYDLSDFHIYEFRHVWKCDQDESNERVHAFFRSPHFAHGIRPIDGARETLSQLQDNFEFDVVTSRQHAIKSETLAWLEEHFSGLLSAVHFGNHYALEGPSRKKSEICLEIGASVLIDDNPRYALEVADAGIDVLLFDWDSCYPWTKPDGLNVDHPLVRRVHNWDDVERELVALRARM